MWPSVLVPYLSAAGQSMMVSMRSAGTAGQLAGVDGDQLGLVGPVVGEADDLVARGPVGDPGANRVDHAGEVGALPGREGRGPAVVQQTPADGRFARVDPGRLHPDDHLAGTDETVLDRTVELGRHLDAITVGEEPNQRNSRRAGLSLSSTYG
jgi:hypothetical protein